MSNFKYMLKPALDSLFECGQFHFAQVEIGLGLFLKSFSTYYEHFPCL